MNDVTRRPTLQSYPSFYWLTFDYFMPQLIYQATSSVWRSNLVNQHVYICFFDIHGSVGLKLFVITFHNV